MTFEETVGSMTLEGIDRWLAGLHPDAVGGYPGRAENCLVARYLREAGYPSVAVSVGEPLLRVGAMALGVEGGVMAEYALPAEVDDLPRRFDAAPTRRGRYVDARTCRRLVRELQAAQGHAGIPEGRPVRAAV